MSPIEMKGHLKSRPHKEDKLQETQSRQGPLGG